MTARNVSGTLIGAAIGGVPFQVAGDANVTLPSSMFEIENVPTSGTNMRKMVKRSQTIEGVVLICNSEDHATVAAFADSLDDTTLAVTTAAGDTYRADGTINIDSYESEELRLTVNMLPRFKWTLSVGEF